MITCPHCGNQEEGGKFCSLCGTKLESSVEKEKKPSLQSPAVQMPTSKIPKPKASNPKTKNSLTFTSKMQKMDNELTWLWQYIRGLNLVDLDLLIAILAGLSLCMGLYGIVGTLRSWAFGLSSILFLYTFLKRESFLSKHAFLAFSLFGLGIVFYDFHLFFFLTKTHEELSYFGLVLTIQSLFFLFLVFYALLCFLNGKMRKELESICFAILVILAVLPIAYMLLAFSSIESIRQRVVWMQLSFLSIEYALFLYQEKEFKAYIRGMFTAKPSSSSESINSENDSLDRGLSERPSVKKPALKEEQKKEKALQYCSHCGNPLPKTAKFCDLCGNPTQEGV